VLFSLILSLIANVLVRWRLLGILDARCSALPGLQNAFLPLALYAVSFISLLIAWATFIGIWNNSYNADDFQFSSGSKSYEYLNPGERSSTNVNSQCWAAIFWHLALRAIPRLREHAGPGFGLAVTAWILTLPCAALYFMFREDTGKAGGQPTEGVLPSSGYAAPPSTPARGKGLHDFAV
jgi:hypothetical protein